MRVILYVLSSWIFCKVLSCPTGALQWFMPVLSELNDIFSTKRYFLFGNESVGFWHRCQTDATKCCEEIISTECTVLTSLCDAFLTYLYPSEGGGPRVVVSTAAFHARVRGSVPGLGGLKETKMFLPHPRVKVSIVGSLRDREVACSASDRQGSNFESCVWRTVSSQSSHHPQEVLLAQFSLYVHKGGLKPDSFHFICTRVNTRRRGLMSGQRRTMDPRPSLEPLLAQCFLI